MAQVILCFTIVLFSRSAQPIERFFVFRVYYVLVGLLAVSERKQLRNALSRQMPLRKGTRLCASIFALE